jgi:hypothetical protein
MLVCYRMEKYYVLRELHSVYIYIYIFVLGLNTYSAILPHK